MYNLSYENVSLINARQWTCKLKLISIWKVVHHDSFWNRGKRQLGNGLLQIIRSASIQSWTIKTVDEFRHLPNTTHFGLWTMCFRVGACSQSCSACKSWPSKLVALSLSAPWAPWETWSPFSFPWSLVTGLIDTRMTDASWSPVVCIPLSLLFDVDALLSSSSNRRL